MEAEEGEGTEERQTGGVLLPPSVRTGGNKSPLSISLLTALYWARSLGQRAALRQQPTSLLGRTYVSLQLASRLKWSVIAAESVAESACSPVNQIATIKGLKKLNKMAEKIPVSAARVPSFRKDRVVSLSSWWLCSRESGDVSGR